MSISIVSHGDWARYAPAEPDPVRPANAMYCRRAADGADWYAFLASDPFQPGSVAMTVLDVGDALVVQAVAAEADRLFPAGCRLIEVAGIAETDPTALIAAWCGRVYDPAYGTIGDVYAPPAPVPDISDRQFAHELRLRGIISQAEALAYVGSGTLPAALAALVAGLPAEQRDDAELLLAGATVFQRGHPLTAAIGAAFGWDDAEIDEFFRAAAAR